MKKILVIVFFTVFLSGCFITDYLEKKVKKGQDFVLGTTQDIGKKTTDFISSSFEKSKREANNYLNQKIEGLKININLKIEEQKEELKEYIANNLLPDLKNYLTSEIREIIEKHIRDNNLQLNENLSEEEKMDVYIQLVNNDPKLKEMVVEEISGMIEK